MHTLNRRVAALLSLITIVGFSFLQIRPAQALENLAPVISSQPSTSEVVAGTTFSYQIQASDPNGDFLSYTLASAGSGAKISPTGLVTISTTKAGPYTLKTRVIDTTGLFADQIISLSIIPAQATSLTVTPMNPAIRAGETVAFLVLAVDIYGNEFPPPSSIILSLPQSAGGEISGTSYQSQYAGIWGATIICGSLSAHPSIFVAQREPIALELKPSATTLRAGQSTDLQSTLSDAQGNTWDATGFAKLTTESQKNLTRNTYSPKKTGKAKVVSQIGSLSANAELTITPAAPHQIVIEPRSVPMSINVRASKQFTAKVTDAYDNLISSEPITWAITNPKFASISSKGTLVAKQAGSLRLTATAFSLSTEIDIQIISTLASAGKTITARPPQGNVKGESATKEETLVPVKVSEGTQEDSSKKSTSDCQTPRLWLTLIAYILYAGILGIYYLAIRRETDGTWWIFPVLLSGIGVIVWIKYFCGGYTWWPWLLIVLGIILTMLLKRKPLESKPEPPKQPPMF